MIFLIWLLYIPALYLVYGLRLALAGMGIYLHTFPTMLLHGAVFVGVYHLVKLLKKLLKVQPRIPANAGK